MSVFKDASVLPFQKLRKNDSPPEFDSFNGKPTATAVVDSDSSYETLSPSACR